MSSPTIKHRHVSSITLFKDDDNGYEIGWRWPRGDNPHLFVAYKERGIYTQITTFTGGKIYLPKGSNQPYYIVIDSATSGDVIFVWNNKEVYRRHAQFPDARVITGSERQCDGKCEVGYTNCPCGCGLTASNCGWETNYSHFWGLTKRRHDFSWVNWENLRLFADDDWEYYLYKISNTDHKVRK